MLPTACALFFLAFLSYCSGVNSQATVVQPASESVSLGQTAKLSCSRSSAGSWNSYFCWSQQRAGQAPRHVYCDGYSRGDGIPDRFTASSSGANAYLTITNIQPEDEAEYYCAIWYGTGSMYIFGGGTMLSVLGQPVSPPTVSLYPPSAEEMTNGKATMVCLVDDFYPGSVNIAWSADGTDITQNVETAKPTKQGEKYVASSYLTMSLSQYNEHDIYNCKVTHEGKTVEKSIKRS